MCGGGGGGGGCSMPPCGVLCRIVEGHIQLDKFFDRKCAATLAERGSRKLEDGSYQFTRDIRVKSVSNFNL